MYTQYIATSGPGTGFTDTGSVLFNNSTGASLVIWSVELTVTQIAQGTTNVLPSQALGGIGYGPPNHTSIGPSTDGYNLGVPGATPVGVVYGFSGTSVPSGYGQGNLGGIIGGTFAASFKWDRRFPIANLPPNYGFMIFSVGETAQIANNTSVVWWYEVVLSPYP